MNETSETHEPTGEADEPATSAVAFPNDSLAAALVRHSIPLPDEQIQKLDRYCQLLWDWNTKINLTRHTDYDRFVGRDVRDSLELSRLLHSAEEVLDVGTGGGVPGVVLAILRPDLQVALCDSVGKKVKVVEQIVAELGLEVPVYPIRAEELLEDTRYDALVIRAVGPLWKLLQWFRPQWASMRRLLVVKGPKWNEELTEAKRRGLVRDLELKPAAQYDLPGTGSQSVILKIWRKGTPER